jgi:CPA1 family monovalent cation:H+ antiporter
VGEIEFLFLLLAAAAVLVRLADGISIPYPIVLVVGGLAIGLIPALPNLELDPDVVFLVFLPPLLLSAGYYASPRELKAELRPLALLAIGLVLATMAAVAVVAHAIVPGMSWEAAFVLGAIVGPTDPVSATATFSRIGAPARLRMLVEGEAMINDGTALVAYRTAAAVAVGTASFSFWGASLDFIVSAVGGVAVGLAAGWVIVQIRRRIDDIPVEITISLLSGFAGYVPAEAIGVSGVLAAVTTGIVLGWKAPYISTASMRLQGYAVWEILTFLLNALLFVLIGLQLPLILDGLSGMPPGELLWWCVAVSLVVIVTRVIWSQSAVFVLRAIDRRESQRERRSTWQSRMIISWCGMRGSVSLAAALALDSDFPERNLILLLTFAVIFSTLVLQGLTLPALIRTLGVTDDGADAQEELIGRRAAAAAALGRLDELAVEEWTYDETIERMRKMYEYRTRRFAARAGETDDGDGIEHRSRKYQKAVRAVLDAQRAELVRLRNAGEISNEVMHRLERELDLEDERLEI